MQYSGEMHFVFPDSFDLSLVSSVEMAGQLPKTTFSSAEGSYEVKNNGIPQM